MDISIQSFLCGWIARKEFYAPSNHIVQIQRRCHGFDKWDEMDLATENVGHMDYENILSWNLLTDGYTRNEDFEVALKLFDEMHRRNNLRWTALVDGLLKCSKDEMAREVFDQSYSAHYWFAGRANVGITRGTNCCGCKVVSAHPVNMELCKSIISDEVVACGAIVQAVIAWSGFGSYELDYPILTKVETIGNTFRDEKRGKCWRGSDVYFYKNVLLDYWDSKSDNKHFGKERALRFLRDQTISKAASSTQRSLRMNYNSRGYPKKKFFCFNYCKTELQD